MPSRMAAVGDLWADMQQRGQSLTSPIARLRRLKGARRDPV